MCSARGGPGEILLMKIEILFPILPSIISSILHSRKNLLPVSSISVLKYE